MWEYAHRCKAATMPISRHNSVDGIETRRSSNAIFSVGPGLALTISETSSYFYVKVLRVAAEVRLLSVW